VKEGEGIIRKVDDHLFTEEVLAAADGKVVPLRSNPDGPIIGEATLYYDPDAKALKAEFQVTDPKVAEFLSGPPPNIFE
jgi:hypothetical protein